MALAGWEIEGVERDVTAAELARSASGCVVHVGDLFRAKLPTNEYDLVVLNHVFEHLAEPVRALCRMNELLAPGGRVVLLYPNPGSVSASYLGSCWPHWDPPRHLVLPTGRALRTLAKTVGFDCTSYRTRPTRASLVFAHGRAYAAGRSVEVQGVRALDRIVALTEVIPVDLG